ncbi:MULTISPECIES: DNA-binding transcriptional regulator [unclassified Okeania]|uniref:helix-turn-helix domain-containing protein n=1 Tax=unclassified Okeania TaxID=2634635 RepID=UPI0013C02DBC|nr:MULTISPECIES: helix-turn-helix transcriptional regulator [unclassified Okeania]NEN89980.1 helix-turn-helix transcriptional regulator [Okeania sp. SIO3H1]NET24087.1 helix-turn-helix transcriptional regulator [Okeania sp. SIO1I7]NET41685.1 helix-turn-helix transcriptional regulator [Okeania sp. SIO2B3]
MDMEALRERARLTRAEVADRLGISETSVRNWETGRTEPTMTPQKYLEILDILKCTPEELAVASDKSISQRHKRKPGRPRKTIENNDNNNGVSEIKSTESATGH